MKLIREHINEKFEEQSDPIRDMGIGKVPYHYNNLYVAKHDIEYVSNGHKVKVPKGTIISAQGGGSFGDYTGKISLGNISKVNGKPVNTSNYNYEIRKDKNNYVEIYYDIWERSTVLIQKIEDFFRHNIEIAAKKSDINSIYDTLEHEKEIMKKIEELIK